MIKKGDRVLYVLTAEDAVAINRRRTHSGSILERIERGVWPVGAQAHIGNDAKEGASYPGVVVEDFAKPSGAIRTGEEAVNLQVWLDGTDSYWATSRHEDANGAPGTFSRLR